MAVYLSPADNCEGPLPCRRPKVNQPVKVFQTRSRGKRERSERRRTLGPASATDCHPVIAHYSPVQPSNRERGGDRRESRCRSARTRASARGSDTPEGGGAKPQITSSPGDVVHWMSAVANGHLTEEPRAWKHACGVLEQRWTERSVHRL
jgi:hypothetical protein